VAKIRERLAMSEKQHTDFIWRDSISRN
jgi:hypothetical protein